MIYRKFVTDFPPLRPLLEEEKPYHQRKRPSRKLPPESRIVDNPYAYEDILTSYWPLLVTIVSVFPIVYCLCKMWKQEEKCLMLQQTDWNGRRLRRYPKLVDLVKWKEITKTISLRKHQTFELKRRPVFEVGIVTKSELSFTFPVSIEKLIILLMSDIIRIGRINFQVPYFECLLLFWDFFFWTFEKAIQYFLIFITVSIILACIPLFRGFRFLTASLLTFSIVNLKYLFYYTRRSYLILFFASSI